MCTKKLLTQLVLLSIDYGWDYKIGLAYVLAIAPQVKWHSLDEVEAGKILTSELLIEDVFVYPHAWWKISPSDSSWLGVTLTQPLANKNKWYKVKMETINFRNKMHKVVVIRDHSHFSLIWNEFKDEPYLSFTYANTRYRK